MRFFTGLVLLCGMASAMPLHMHHRLSILQEVLQAADNLDGVSVTSGPEDCPYKDPFVKMTDLRKTVFYGYQKSGVKQHDPAKIAIPGTPGFAFEEEKYGRVVSAQGFVLRDGGATNPADWVYPYIYCQYYHSQPFNNKPDPSDTSGSGRKLRSPLYNSKLMNAGHIIAASLGGSNGDPQNFFAQYEKSNKLPGTYNKMEALVRDVQDYLDQSTWKTTGDAASCNVFIKITFTYPDPTATQFFWWPSEGVYSVGLSSVCAGKLVSATDGGANVKRLRAQFLKLAEIEGGVPSHMSGSTVVMSAGYIFSYAFKNTNNAAAQVWMD